MTHREYRLKNVEGEEIQEGVVKRSFCTTSNDKMQVTLIELEDVNMWYELHMQHIRVDRGEKVRLYGNERSHGNFHPGNKSIRAVEVFDDEGIKFTSIRNSSSLEPVNEQDE
jgi:hypothetical protein